PLWASTISQTVMLFALAVRTEPLAVEAAAASVAARIATTMIRAFISPPEGVGALGRSRGRAPIGLVHRPRPGDWHSPLCLSRAQCCADHIPWQASGLDHQPHRVLFYCAVTKQDQIRARVTALIRELGVGQAIPSERRLSTELGVSRLTLRAALDELVREGYLVRRHGSGTFVSEPKIAQQLTLTSFTEDMRRRGMVADSRTISLDNVHAGPQVARALN